MQLREIYLQVTISHPSCSLVPAWLLYSSNGARSQGGTCVTTEQAKGERVGGKSYPRIYLLPRIGQGQDQLSEFNQRACLKHLKVFPEPHTPDDIGISRRVNYTISKYTAAEHTALR